MLRADAFVLSSRVEGVPNAMLEAMALGLPCVALDCPSGPREISEDGRVAALVPPGEAGALAASLAEVMRQTPAWRAAKIGRAHVELQSLMRNSYAVFCLKKKQKRDSNQTTTPYSCTSTRHQH